MLSIQKIDAEHIDTLRYLSKQTFYESYAHLSRPDDIEEYCSRAFSQNQLLRELEIPKSFFYFAVLNNEPIGCLKLNFGNAQTEFKNEDGMEIERIYLLKEYHSKRLGQQLMDFALQEAINKQVPYVWLGVWDKNTAAIRFYQRNGFKVFGTHTFPFGDEKDADLLMKLKLD